MMDTVQLSIFIQNINITEEMVELYSIKSTILDIFIAFKLTLTVYSLKLNNLSGIVTDGVTAIISKHKGLTMLIKNEKNESTINTSQLIQYIYTYKA